MPQLVLLCSENHHEKTVMCISLSLLCINLYLSLTFVCAYVCAPFFMPPCTIPFFFIDTNPFKREISNNKANQNYTHTHTHTRAHIHAHIKTALRASTNMFIPVLHTTNHIYIRRQWKFSQEEQEKKWHSVII